MDSLIWRLTVFMLRGSAGDRTEGVPASFVAVAKQWSHQTSTLHEVEREVRALGSLVCAISVLFPFEQRREFIRANQRQTHRALDALRRRSRAGIGRLCATRRKLPGAARSRGVRTELCRTLDGSGCSLRFSRFLLLRFSRRT